MPRPRTSSTSASSAPATTSAPPRRARTKRCSPEALAGIARRTAPLVERPVRELGREQEADGDDRDAATSSGASSIASSTAYDAADERDRRRNEPGPAVDDRRDERDEARRPRRGRRAAWNVSSPRAIGTAATREEARDAAGARC